MKKKLSYRKARKGVAEQYSVSINQEMIRSLGITSTDREVDLFYDRALKRIVIKKSETTVKSE
ncbi:hypothetical protein [uncultured Fusobacterium sp.]|jgi:hypothetical protein|uniref:hypothetical protein n=1 Tax=uncultured Fusobacterium sp. TaxID=159267 RepID=UPI0015A53BB0|nr:hypothetical protein [uncultured Fusobacterium sp.]